MLRLEARRCDADSWVRVVSTASGGALREWHGEIARRILDCAFQGTEPLERISSARKEAIRRVHLAAAAVSLSRDRAKLTEGGHKVPGESRRIGNKWDLVEKMRRCGIRCTSQRLAVARCLYDSSRHLSAPMVLDRLCASGSRCSRATVYNTLNLFARKGLVRPVAVNGGPVFFDPVTTPHPHVYRTDTGKLQDLDPEILQALQGLTLPDGLQAEGIDLVVRARPVD